MNATLLLQARTSSSRLPGKVLLPIAGMPLVVLAARRAGNTGLRVVVVTSHEPSDDVLCELLSDWGIPFFRGDLDNTLKRFVDALDSVADDHVVVRLTGDNILPDGIFIEEMLEDFEQHNLPYLCCGGETSGLPYGVSAEVTRASYLREAHRITTSSYDREHVTPWIIRHHGRQWFERYRTLGLGQYRCTVDRLDDYLLVSGLFRNIKDPDQQPMANLLKRLVQASSHVVTSTPASRMVLGTAQFGLNYGIANSAGQPAPTLVRSLIRTAIDNGVQYLDTARGYGDSEEMLGQALTSGWGASVTIVTKLSPLADCPAEADSHIAGVFAERSVYKSCQALGVPRLDVLLLHRANHLTAWQGGVWQTLLELKSQGLIGALGVSVQSPDEALSALEYEDVAFIQLPYNILDYRWDAVIVKITEVRRSRSLVVHARSILLQGLLPSDRKDLWQRACCTIGGEVIDWLRIQADQYTHGDVVELCLRYVLSQTWIDAVVIGVDTREQLIANLIKAGSQSWSNEKLEAIVMDRPHVSPATLNPATWKRAND